jgi:hypothetical protein
MGNYDAFEIHKKIVGHIQPVGETNEDNRRFESLKEEIEVLTIQMEQMFYLAEKRNRSEFSISRAGKKAYNYLKELGDDIQNFVD